MIADTGSTALLATALVVGVTHTLMGPDHYLPFVALSKAHHVLSRQTSLLVLESPAMARAFDVHASRPEIDWSGEEAPIAGETAALDFLQLGSHSLKGLRHLLIFTDGLFPPGEDPAGQPDFCWLAEHYLQGGLDKVKQEIRRLECEDPECRRFPRFKQHDDIAAMAISFG